MDGFNGHNAEIEYYGAVVRNVIKGKKMMKF